MQKEKKNSPITFKKFNEQSVLNKNIKPWGSIVLLGKKTKGSYIKNVHFKGGSGGWYNQYYFTSICEILNIKVSFTDRIQENKYIHLNGQFKFNNNKIIKTLLKEIDGEIKLNSYIKRTLL